MNLIEARRVPHGRRIRFLEHAFPGLNPIEYYKAVDRPRLIKTHLPSTFFREAIESSAIRVVVMTRDPRDALVSFYRFYAADPGYVRFAGSWNDFFLIFEAKRLLGGDWFQNALSWLRYGDRENVHVVRYEDVLTDSVLYIHPPGGDLLRQVSNRRSD